MKLSNTQKKYWYLFLIMISFMGIVLEVYLFSTESWSSLNKMNKFGRFVLPIIFLNGLISGIIKFIKITYSKKGWKACLQPCIAASGARRCNFSYISLSALVLRLTRSKNLFGNFIIIFLFIISAGQTIFNFPTCGNAKRWPQ